MTPADQMPGGYWHDLERQLAISNHRDRQAARAVNADNLLHDNTPFGTHPQPPQPATQTQEATTP